MVRVLASAEEVARAGAEEFIRIGHESIDVRDRFCVALSGGSTPKRMHGILAEDYRNALDWSKVHVLFGDERYVTRDDAQSNERMARETLLSLVPIPESQVHGMYAPGGPDAAAQAYEEALRTLIGEGRLDLVLLGLGPDGHTASLFPGRPSLKETQRWVIAAKANAAPEDRITFTRTLINRAAHVLFLVAGKDKSGAVRRAIEGEWAPEETPAQLVAREDEGRVLWLLDSSAASELGER